MARKRPLPRAIELPGGFHVDIRYVPAAEMPANDGEWYLNRTSNGGLIKINRSLPREKKLEILMLHEFDHVFADFKLFFKREFE